MQGKDIWFRCKAEMATVTLNYQIKKWFLWSLVNSFILLQSKYYVHTQNITFKISRSIYKAVYTSPIKKNCFKNVVMHTHGTAYSIPKMGRQFTSNAHITFNIPLVVQCTCIAETCVPSLRGKTP